MGIVLCPGAWLLNLTQDHNSHMTSNASTRISSITYSFKTDKEKKEQPELLNKEREQPETEQEKGIFSTQID